MIFTFDLHVLQLAESVAAQRHEVSLYETSRPLDFGTGSETLRVLMVMLMVMVFMYRIFYMHIQMRFTLLQCKGEIGRQHI